MPTVTSIQDLYIVFETFNITTCTITPYTVKPVLRGHLCDKKMAL